MPPLRSTPKLQLSIENHKTKQETLEPTRKDLQPLKTRTTRRHREGRQTRSTLKSYTKAWVTHKLGGNYTLQKFSHCNTWKNHVSTHMSTQRLEFKSPTSHCPNAHCFLRKSSSLKASCFFFFFDKSLLQHQLSRSSETARNQ